MEPVTIIFLLGLLIGGNISAHQMEKKAQQQQERSIASENVETPKEAVKK